MFESIIKVMTRQGLTDFTELEIPYNSSKENINIEKADAVKMNGEKIKADISGNLVVFKNLEIGDCIHLKFRVNNYYDYLLSTHVWNKWVFENFYPVLESRYELLVPENKEFNYVTHGAINEPEIAPKENFKHYVWKMNGLEAVIPEVDMPILEDVGRAVSISSLTSWEEIVQWYKEITWSKPRATYEIKDLITELTLDRELLSDNEKIKLVYDYITENITYSSVPFRQSSHTPQKARKVLSTRIGDCKDVSTLGISMLRELGIDAQYTLLNTRDEGLNIGELPSVNLFNHCIISVDTEVGRKFYDLTARNHPFNSLPDQDKNAFYLLIDEDITEPEFLDPSGYIPNKSIFSQLITVQNDNSILVKESSILSGNMGAIYRFIFRDKSDTDINREMKEFITKVYPNVNITDLKLENLDIIDSDCLVDVGFEVPNYLMTTGSFKLLKLEWNFKMTSSPSLSYDIRKFPIRDWSFLDDLEENMTIDLPDDLMPVELKEISNISSEFADYSLTFKYEDNKIIGKREIRIKKKDIEPDEYVIFRDFYNEMIKFEEMQILLKQKD